MTLHECVCHTSADCVGVYVCVFPACVFRSVSDDEEVDDPGGEVQSHVGFTVDHCDTVSVTITGPWHATAEQQEWRPTQTHTHTHRDRHTHRFKFSAVYLQINE